MPVTWNINTDDIEGEQIGADEAAEILMRRLRDVDQKLVRRFTNGIWDRLTDWLTDVTASMPPEALTEDFVKNMALRPFLLQAATDMELETDDDAKRLYSSLFVSYSDQLRGKLEAELFEAAQAGTLPGDITAESIPMYVDGLLKDDLGDFTQHRQNFTKQDDDKFFDFYQPAIDPETGMVVGNPANNDAANDFLDMMSEITNSTSGRPQPSQGAFMSDKDITWLFRTETPGTAIDTYVGELQYREQERASGVVTPGDSLGLRFDEDLNPNARPDPGYIDTSSLAGISDASTEHGRVLSLTQSLDLPFSMTRQQVAAASEKMKKAGLYSQIPGGEPTVKGDPSDPQFKQAWQLMVSKMVQGGRDAQTFLTESAESFKETLEETNEDALQLQLTDPARLRIAADTLGQQVLGRKMTKQEQARLVQQIHQWQRTEGQEILDVTNSDEGGEVTEVDWQARMEEMIRNDNSGEAGARDVQQQYDRFRAMLGGPQAGRYS